MAKVAVVYYGATGDVASLDHLAWCDANISGAPTRLGNVSSRLEQFIDTAGGLWVEGEARRDDRGRADGIGFAV